MIENTIFQFGKSKGIACHISYHLNFCGSFAWVYVKQVVSCYPVCIAGAFVPRTPSRAKSGLKNINQLTEADFPI